MGKRLHSGLLSLAVGLLIVLCYQPARADLVMPVVALDNPSAFQGSLIVTQFTQATHTFSSVNWLITVREDFIGSEVIPNGFQITAQHLVTPDPSGLGPNPIVLSLTLFANSTTPGGPARGPFLISGTHDLTSDYLQVSYLPIGPGQSQLIIQTSHGSQPVATPEPSTAALLFGAFVLSGGLMKVLGQRRRSSNR